MLLELRHAPAPFPLNACVPAHLASTTPTQHQERSFQGVKASFAIHATTSSKVQALSALRLRFCREITQVAQLIDILILGASLLGRKGEESVARTRSKLALQLPYGDLRFSAAQIVSRPD
jgi:hypothetical protein